MAQKIYCFGNEYYKEDSLPKIIADELRIKGVDFVRCDSLNDVPDSEENIIILDVARGIKKVEITTNVDSLRCADTVSCHDMDLAFELKLLKSIGQLKKVRIIAVPISYSFEKAKEELLNLLPLDV